MRIPPCLIVTVIMLFASVIAPADEIVPRPTRAKVLLTGNWPDPTVLRDGDDYYMTHSNWTFQPGMLIWHSKDLRTWRPITRATLNHPHSIWAPDLVKHGDTYHLYLPSRGNWVATAKDIRGPWSEPVKLDIAGIDPGHVADDEGNRYLSCELGPRGRPYRGMD